MTGREREASPRTRQRVAEAAPGVRGGSAGADPGRRERRACAGIAATASFILYALTVCPTVSPGDGGELVAASVNLGVAHPPGYPLYTALGWLITRPGLAEPALVMNLLSAALAALCCGVVAWLLHRATGSRETALAGALGFAGSTTFWSSATVTEVYPLHLLLMALLLASAWMAGTATDDRRQARSLLVAGLVVGAGLAHHPTIVLAIPAALVLAWPMLPRARRARGSRPWGSLARALAPGAALAALVPVLSYGWLLLRGRRELETNWGHRTTLRQIWMHITGLDYRRYDLGWAGLVRPERWRWLGGHVAGELTLAALPFVILGLFALKPRDPHRRLAWAALVLAGAHVFFSLRYGVEDADVYLIPAWLGLALLAALGAGRLAVLLGRWGRAGSSAAAALIIAAPMVVHFGPCNMRGVTAAADFGRDVLASVGPNGALVIESDQAFPVFYLSHVLHERPDVHLYGKWGVLGRDMAAETARISGGRYRPENDMQAELAFVDAVLGTNRRSAVHFMSYPGYSIPPRYRLEPAGLTWRVVPAGAPSYPEDVFWNSTREGRVRAQAEDKKIGYLIGLEAAYPVARGVLSASHGFRDRAQSEFDTASRIAGDRDVMTHMRLGILEAALLRDPAKATESFQRALALQPTSFETLNNLASARGMAGDREGARRAFRRSLELSPDQPDVEALLRGLDRPATR